MRLKHLVAIALLVITLAGCSVAQTAVVYRKPESQVTKADQLGAYLAYVTLVRENRRNDPTLVCIRSHESRDVSPSPWHAYNPDGPYYGAYQWLQGSWNSAAAATGRPDLVGLQPIEPTVAWYDQDEVTLAYHQMVGDGPWGNRC